VSVKLIQSKYSASRGKLAISAGGYSSAGVKERNEDSFAINAPEKPSRSTKGIVAVIADGVSHANHAAKASRYCTTELATKYFDAPKTWATSRILSKVLNQLNSNLFSKKKLDVGGLEIEQRPQWLTTLSGIIFKSATAHVFHVGDSQIVRVRDGKFDALTQSHNQRLSPSSIVLTRAMGADHHLEVDYQTFDVQVEDVYFFTTDGVHDFLKKEDFVHACVSQSSEPADLGLACEMLVAKALENGSDDNLTCLVTKVVSVPAQQPDEIRKTLLQKVVPPALEQGQIMEGFKVLRTMHQSARSHLYLVEELSSGTYYTLKAPSVNFSDDEIYLQGFIREAWIGSQIEHPSIMKVLPAKTDSKFLYHICEYIQGQTLRQWMYDHPNPDLQSVRKIISQVIAALRVFKNLDIVHRDIKPENVMLDEQGNVKLIDYGTASIAALEEQVNRFTEEVPMGTVNYIAPETMSHLISDAKSDLFSVGVMTYELLTGKLPYPELSNKSQYSKRSRYSHWQYISLFEHRDDLPFWIDLAIRKSVEVDPHMRYQLYSEFETDLSKPNLSAEQAFEKKPLIERNPVAFWQATSGVLAIIILGLLFN
jgi:serine/threonine protein phosphatase PrpC